MSQPRLLTKNGYVLGEVVSALQKEIRRGQEEGAMFWALELCPRFEAYLWRRLCVIVNEDVGLANPFLLVLVKSQKDLYFEFREQGVGEAKLVLANTILALARSEKSRLADHFNAAVNQGKLREHAAGVNRPIPDYALDKHTARGRNLKRGWDHFLTEGALLEPRSPLPDPYAERAHAFWREGIVKDEWPARGKKASAGELEQGELFSE